MPSLRDLSGSAHIAKALPLLDNLGHEYEKLAGAEQMELEDCLMRVEAVAKQVSDKQTKKLARLYDVQILLMKAQRMTEQKAYEDQKKDLEIADLKLQLAKSSKAKANTELLAEQSKLHMRGLVEYFENMFEKDEHFKKERQEELQRLEDKFRLEHGEIPRKAAPQVSRKDKWILALKSPNFKDVAENITNTCNIHPGEVTTQINALLGKFNNIVHHPLRDVLDSASSTCVVINRHVVGEMPAQLLPDRLFTKERF